MDKIRVYAIAIYIYIYIYAIMKTMCPPVITTMKTCGNSRTWADDVQTTYMYIYVYIYICNLKTFKYIKNG